MSGGLFLPETPKEPSTVKIEEIPNPNAKKTTPVEQKPAPKVVATEQKPAKPVFVPKPCKIVNYKVIGDDIVAGFSIFHFIQRI